MNVLCLGSFVSLFCNRAGGVATFNFPQLSIKTLKIKKKTLVCLVLLTRYTNISGSGCVKDTVKLEGCAGRHRQNDRQESCFLKQACVYREMEYPTFPERLSLTFVPVCLYRCCNRGFPPPTPHPRIPVVCNVLLWNDIYFLVFYFSPSVTVSVCMLLSHYAPKWLWSCNYLLDCGRGDLATNKIQWF